MTGSTILSQDSKEAPYPWQQDNWELLCEQWKKQQFSHAYLFAGEAEMGKSDFALALVKLLLCRQPDNDRACGECVMCLVGGAQADSEAQHPDLLQLAPLEGSKVISVDQVRNLIDFANKTSHSSGKKLIMVHQAEALNINAANALLKTLEEPTPNTYLFLITGAPGKLMPTLRSRCQRLQFNKPSEKLLKSWLNNLGNAEQVSAAMAASGGRPLLAKSMLEQGDTGLGGDVTANLEHLLQRQLSPQDCLAQWKNTEESALLGYLAQTSTIVIKYLLTNDRQLLADAATAQLISTLQATKLPGSELVPRLLEFYTELENARKAVSSSSNPNVQLILESLIWRWSRLSLEESRIGV